MSTDFVATLGRPRFRLPAPLPGSVAPRGEPVPIPARRSRAFLPSARSASRVSAPMPVSFPRGAPSSDGQAPTRPSVIRQHATVHPTPISSNLRTSPGTPETAPIWPTGDYNWLGDNEDNDENWVAAACLPISSRKLRSPGGRRRENEIRNCHKTPSGEKKCLRDGA